MALRDVEIHVVPGDPTLAQKLEAVLSDAVLSSETSSQWPRSLTPLPAEANPILSRIQLALIALGDTPRTEHATLALFDDVPTWGFTRVIRRGATVEVDALALTAAREGGVLASGHLSGERVGDVLALRGERRVGSAAAERVTLTVVASQVGGATP